MKRELILVTGGARAGKSNFAQELAQELSLHPCIPPYQGETIGDKGKKWTVLFVATAEAGDAEMEERIRRHRSSRPADWPTLEEPIHLPEAIAGALGQPNPERSDGVVLVDCLNLWVSNLLLRGQGGEQADIEEEILDAARRLLECHERSRATFILVSNEVGLGLVPTHPLGRLFRDVLGKVNQMVAARADKVYLLVAGLPLELKSLSGQHLLPQEGRR